MAEYFSMSQFPDTLLSYGLAKWAIKSSIAFADEFDKRIGIVPDYTKFEKELPQNINYILDKHHGLRNHNSSLNSY